MQTVTQSHILIDERGVAWIDDTNVKVIEVVLDKIAYGSSPEEMHFEYPHLSLAQIHAALAYYHDHQKEFDEEIERQDKEVKLLRERSKNSPLRQRLRSPGKI
jgi:uncharacterized protein (DUF433 family)